jgi:hypothetical protein
MPIIRCTLLAVAVCLSACGNSPEHTPATAATSPVSSLETVDLKEGGGAAVAAGQTAVVEYTGWLYESAAPDKKGKEFDSSTGHAPFRFKVGAGDVIAGWADSAGSSFLPILPTAAQARAVGSSRPAQRSCSTSSSYRSSPHPRREPGARSSDHTRS